MNNNFDICIIGAGPAGLAAAIKANETNENLKICILEKNEKPGRKLLATGNGKCNISNKNCANIDETLAFFNSIGIVTKEKEDGMLYPYNEKAKDVLSCLEQRVKKQGIEVIYQATTIDIEKEDLCFTVKYRDGKGKVVSQKSKNVILATGGKAAPVYGSVGDGYGFAKDFGHKVTPLAPILTGIETMEDLTKLKGVRSKGQITLLKNDEKLFVEGGEIQFAEYGISGIPVFNMTRFIDRNFGDYQIKIDLLPDRTENQVFELLSNRKTNLKMNDEEILTTIVEEALGKYILKKGNSIKELTRNLKELNLKIKNIRGWKFAQCTKGGVVLDEINLETMESKLTPGLYLTGELIDVDGPCGGYNLQNAWETGMKAGEAAANV